MSKIKIKIKIQKIKIQKIKTNINNVTQLNHESFIKTLFQIKVLQMSKANPETIVSERLSHMAETTKGLNRQKNNLYNHLCQLLSHLPLPNDSKDRKVDSVKELAAISEYIKNCSGRQRQAEPVPEQQLNDIVSTRIQYPDWLSKKRQMFTFMESKKQQSQKYDIIVQNFQKVHKSLFLNAGISLGQEQALRINIALQKLVNLYQQKQKQKANAKKIRFWGKILTKKSDYYVVQGVSTKKFPQQVSQDMEKYREGANYYSYWVNSLAMDKQWHELPLITPQQIRTSKLIKYTFTGDLNAEIKSYPAFNGREEHFLKAQLVRVTHNCQIAPKGLYGPNEENPDEIEFAEDFKIPDFSELSNLQNWVHVNPHILQLGRSSYWVDPKLSEEQKQQQMTKLGQTDPKMQRLKGINQDKPAQGKGAETSWFAKTIGSTQIYTNVGKEEGTTSCYAVVTLRNVNWPGWYTFSNMSLFDSIYIGSGIKATQAGFFPMGPQNLLFQGQDIQQFSEPNPRNPPDELQPDSDDQNKKPEQ